MIKVIYRTALLVVLVAGIVSCKKDASLRSSEFTGKWELRGLSGGIGGFVYDYKAGSGNYYEFKPDNTYEYHERDVSNVIRGTYNLKFDGTRDGYRQGTVTFIENKQTNNVYLRADTLIMDQDIADGFRARYIRIK